MCRNSAFELKSTRSESDQNRLEVDFDEQLGDFLVELADVVFHAVHRDFVLVRLFQIRGEDLPPVP